MRFEDRDILNEALSILYSTKLDDPLLWLWNWDVANYLMHSTSLTPSSTEDTVWEDFFSTENGHPPFSLEDGADAFEDKMLAWLEERGHVMGEVEVEQDRSSTKHKDKAILNQVIDLLDTSELGLVILWLIIWNEVLENIKQLPNYSQKVEDEIWTKLYKKADDGEGFSLDMGLDSLRVDIKNWLESLHGK